ncbi:MAG: 16S rRNA (guanine(527)-N(7))-methyltransferase RsmG [Pelagibacteraceae bacterium TMED287]|nr:MAG: 16S rRNA (guanine(527)-N(7))-methyltransferase RsmG [Pelagibacteraceae bacterium TMED287]|tara:strand:+ start:981 stop:1601 length:621 start_codon:yes stop_codon:yes gene_type:complete
MKAAEIKSILVKELKFDIQDIKKLELFEEQLLLYNKKYNLISKSTENEIWNRHILDSAQLVKFIDFNLPHSLSDMGSGAGFPGLVLSIFNKNNRFHVKLYEKSKVKCDFLKNIINNLNIQCRIYDNDYHSHNIDSNYIVSRAFKKLPELMRISREIASKPHKLIVLKGKSAQEEVNKLPKEWNYKYRLEVSLTNKDSRVLIVNINK